MKQPTPEELDAIQRVQGNVHVQTILGWIRRNLAVAQTNLETFDGAEMHRTQGDARTLRGILNTVDAESGNARRAEGRAR